MLRIALLKFQKITRAKFYRWTGFSAKNIVVQILPKDRLYKSIRVYIKVDILHKIRVHTLISNDMTKIKK